jgi:hypothetical protein
MNAPKSHYLRFLDEPVNPGAILVLALRELEESGRVRIIDDEPEEQSDDAYPSR